MNKLLNPTPAPKPTAGLIEHPTWSGRAIVHADHGPELDRAAAVYELGENKLPRSQAEERAHADYKHKQHVAAAAHHLSGMRGAAATGDLEAARKHGAMYELHCKAIGHDASGPTHPEVAAKMFNNPAGFHKFKAHRGDLFAIPGDEPITKAEILHGLYKAFTTFDQLKAAAKDPKSGADTEGGAFGSIPGYSSRGADEEDEDASSLNKWAKAELAARKAASKPAKKAPCACPHYPFPHRAGGGRCK